MIPSVVRTAQVPTCCYSYVLLDGRVQLKPTCDSCLPLSVVQSNFSEFDRTSSVSALTQTGCKHNYTCTCSGTNQHIRREGGMDGAYRAQLLQEAL